MGVIDKGAMGVIVHWVLLVVAYGGLAYSLFCIARSLLALSWPSTNGKLIAADIAVDRSGDSTTYQPLIEYTYVVDGQEYNSQRFAFGYFASSERMATRVYSRFVKYSYVTVYYNPSHPACAVLLRGVKIFHLTSILFFLFLTWVVKLFF